MYLSYVNSLEKKALPPPLFHNYHTIVRVIHLSSRVGTVPTGTVPIYSEKWTPKVGSKDFIKGQLHN